MHNSYFHLYIYTLGMVLVHPKKDIYKDGHERADTVAYRKLFIAELKTFKSREEKKTLQDAQARIQAFLETQCHTETTLKPLFLSE